jgi:hypothetical protein
MGERNKGEDWLSEALFGVGELVGHKGVVDADLARDEFAQKVADLNDRQKVAFIELLASRGTELYSTTGQEVAGVEVPKGAEYLFTRSLSDALLMVVKAMSGQEPVCDYCLEVVDLDDVENACKQATLWVSGPKSQNTRMRTYTGAYAHKKCIEAHLAKKDTTQELLEL